MVTTDLADLRGSRANSKSPAWIGQKQPLASKLLVLVFDWTAVPFRKFFALRRVGAELFGLRLHVMISL